MALRVKAILDADGARFQQTMGRAERTVNRFAGRLAAVFSAGAMIAFSKRTVEWASRMTDLAAQTGLAVEEIQRLDRIAIKTGTDLGMLTKAFQNIEYKRGMALANPNGPAAAGFAAFGFSGESLRSASSQDILREIGSRGTGQLNKMTFQLRSIFEETGPQLVEAFSMYSTDALQNMATMSAETAKQMDAVSDSFGTLNQKLMIEFSPAILLAVKGIGLLVASIKGLADAAGTASEDDGWKRYKETILKAEAGWARQWLGIMEYWIYGGGEGNRKGGERMMRDAALNALFGNATKAFSGEKINDPIAAFFDAIEEFRGLFGGDDDGGDGKPTRPAVNIPKFQKAATAGSLYTDSLVGTGNFLGAGTTPMAIRQIQEKQLVALNSINDSVKTVLNVLHKFGLGGYPS